MRQQQGHYMKQDGPGRVWYINVIVPADEHPVIVGDEVLITRRNGQVDTLIVTEVVEATLNGFKCKFRHKVKAPKAPQDLGLGQVGEDDEPAPEAPAPMAQPAPHGNGALTDALMQAIGAPIAQLAADRAAGAVEVRMKGMIEEVSKRVADIANAQVAPLEIHLPNVPTPILLEEHRHPLFDKVLRLTSIPGMNVLLVGPAGCGKTFLAHQIAKGTARKCGSLHCTAGMSEGAVSGRLLPSGDHGAFLYHPSEFVNLYQEGNSVFLLDEIDAADPNVLMFLNGALANGALHIPHRLEGAYIPRGENVSIIAAANTFGTGADMMYQGRNPLDGATLDRFYTVRMDYDATLEYKKIGAAPPYKAPWQAADKPTNQELESLGRWVLALRDKTDKAKLRRIISTRTLQKAIDARTVGLPSEEVKQDILAGWTKDELAKVGEYV